MKKIRTRWIWPEPSLWGPVGWNIGATYAQGKCSSKKRCRTPRWDPQTSGYRCASGKLRRLLEIAIVNRKS